MPSSSAILDLPLSWARTDASAPRLRTLRLPLSRRTWAPCVDVPCDWSFQQVFEEQLRLLPRGVILQGCNETLARYLKSMGGQVAQVGMEAVLPVQAAVKSDALYMARRGRREGEIMELEPDSVNQAKIAALWKVSAHSAKPRMQCTFRTDFEPPLRGFVMVGRKGTWLGAMTLSLMKPGYWHAELLLRRADAPPGVMDALILDIKSRLLTEGARWLSLGTVPFVITAAAIDAHPCHRPWTPACRGRAITRLGRLLRFGYDYRGLYRFKNKYTPDWRPLYLCGWPDLPWRILPDLSWASRHLHLVGYAALQRISRRKQAEAEESG